MNNRSFDDERRYPLMPDFALAREIEAMPPEAQKALFEWLDSPFEGIRSNRAPVIETGKDKNADPE
ncbi:MAG: hypothetical protein WC761_04885 [Candidatus Paceibacterota bacterium]|jgi:hypothetical protein